MSTLEQYRASEREQERTRDLLRILPKGRRSVLDIGAREGHFSRLLTEYFSEVTALDLRKPEFEFPGIVTVQGDATRLNFPDDSFDCVFCAEVLEHIPDVQAACKEIARVARHEIIIGVPFQQDVRLGRTTCHSCRKISPPWGHVNSFTERKLFELFAGLTPVTRSFVGSNKEVTNPISTYLMDRAGNPWGPYEQDEPCGHCGARLIAPKNRTVLQRGCSALALYLNRAQSHFARPHGNWIHLVFSKNAEDRPRRETT
jgi:ubiquinone/menaquinone biosynthesis C-methylase UbiE